MRKLVMFAAITMISILAVAGGKPTPVSPPNLVGQQITLSTGVVLQFYTDQVPTGVGYMVDSVYGPMDYMYLIKGNTYTVSMANPSSVDNTLVLKFVTPTSGTFTREAYVTNTKKGTVRTSGTFIMQSL